MSTEPSQNWLSGEISTSSLMGQVAIILAAFFYAVFAVYSRQIITNGTSPIVISTGAMTSAAVASGIGMLVFPLLGGQPPTPLTEVSRETIAVILLLGTVNTFLAYMMSYWVIGQLGATRASQITYVVLAVGLTLGVLVMNEPLTGTLLVGSALVFSGVGVTNLKIKRSSRSRLCHPVKCGTACMDSGCHMTGQIVDISPVCPVLCIN